MKKLSIISNQIKNNTFSYTGKGSFEAIVNQHKDKVLDWLEDLIPLQQQIEELKDLEDLDFQKRNYTRILSKLFPKEYTEFVSQNILIRDAAAIAKHYDREFNVTILYDNLLKDKYLKYPGKYEKYVDYNIFQRFLMMYKDDLMKSLDAETNRVKGPRNRQGKVIYDSLDPQERLIFDEEEEEQKKAEELTEEKQTKKAKEKTAKQQKDTNWTQLLLGKIK